MTKLEKAIEELAIDYSVGNGFEYDDFSPHRFIPVFTSDGEFSHLEEIN
jgi:hypothetical protein